MFRALVLEEADGKVSSSIQELDEASLPDGDVTVAIDYSTLNYKDGMILGGIGRMVRNYPHIGGIDFAGTVEESAHHDYHAGDKVILTGWRVGEAHWGGYSQKSRVKGDWLVHLPENLSTRQAMALGTAGFTAMLSVQALEDHGLGIEDGEVLVTGAAGGVGSVAVAVLASQGYSVTSSTGREETHGYLQSLGASNIIARSELAEPTKRPLDSERWAGCVDSVGGTTLARLLTQMKYRSSVAAVGLAGGSALETTVIPFLLRGVNLLGIDSVMCPYEPRRKAWARLAEQMPMDKLESMITEATLSDLAGLGGDILKGQVRGRVVVDVNA